MWSTRPRMGRHAPRRVHRLPSIGFLAADLEENPRDEASFVRHHVRPHEYTLVVENGARLLQKPYRRRLAITSRELTERVGRFPQDEERVFWLETRRTSPTSSASASAPPSSLTFVFTTPAAPTTQRRRGRRRHTGGSTTASREEGAGQGGALSDPFVPRLNRRFGWFQLPHDGSGVNGRIAATDGAADRRRRRRPYNSRADLRRVRRATPSSPTPTSSSSTTRRPTGASTSSVTSGERVSSRKRRLRHGVTQGGGGFRPVRTHSEPDARIEIASLRALARVLDDEPHVGAVASGSYHDDVARLLIAAVPRLRSRMPRRSSSTAFSAGDVDGRARSRRGRVRTAWDARLGLRRLHPRATRRPRRAQRAWTRATFMYCQGMNLLFGRLA